MYLGRRGQAMITLDRKIFYTEKNYNKLNSKIW